MCRWIAYQGEPTFLDVLVAEPAHSLIAQSLCASETKVVTNGDGFGIGWYGARQTPGIYREVRPAWSDENLRSICHQVQSSLFFAHVRASTGPAIARANCHPFAVGRFMFMHNGQVGQYCAIKRRLEGLIPDDLYHHRSGTTDSEALFLAAFGFGLEADPVGGLTRTLHAAHGLMTASGVREPLKMTAALTDGRDLYAVRWASDGQAPTLYWRQNADSIVVVSEPLDGERAQWREVPQGCVLVARDGRCLSIEPLDEVVAAEAA